MMTVTNTCRLMYIRLRYLYHWKCELTMSYNVFLQALHPALEDAHSAYRRMEAGGLELPIASFFH